MVRSTWVLLWCLVAMTSSWPALADSAAAEALFQKGRALMNAKKYAEACDAFASSLAEEPSPGTMLNLALCHEKQGKLATAWAEYKKAAPLFRARNERRRAEFALKRAEEVEPKLSYLRIDVEPRPDGLHLERDGDDIPVAALDTDLPVDPGEIVITAAAPGYESFETTVDTTSSGVQDVTISLVKLPEESPEPTPEPRPETDADEGMSGMAIAGLVVGGVGVAMAVVGGVVGGLVLSDASDAESDPGLCPNRQCTPEGREAIDAAESKALASNVLIGVGAGAAVGGLILFLVAPEETDEEEARIIPRLAPTEVGVDLRLRF